MERIDEMAAQVEAMRTAIAALLTVCASEALLKAYDAKARETLGDLQLSPPEYVSSVDRAQRTFRKLLEL